MEKLNKEVLDNIHISSHESVILKSLEAFYLDAKNSNKFISFLNSHSQISIRLIDYFITKYSKNNKTSYKITENNTEHTFNVNSSYKEQLKRFQKKHFDPFSRGDRIPYFMNDICVITTIGQLNFFKWYITKNINEYVKNNVNLIENEMNKKTKSEKNKIKKDNKIKKYKNIIINKPIFNNKINSENKKLDCITVSFSIYL
jgi:hypothetical protein